MPAITLYAAGEFRYAVDPESHLVADPQRAMLSFAAETRRAAARHLGVALAALLGMPILAVVFYVIDQRTQGDAFPGNLIAIGLIIATPFVAGGLALQAWRAFRLSRRAPQRSTVEDTLNGFFNAISVGAWENAYNHLTDTAQVIEPVPAPRDDHLQKAMPAVHIDSLNGFRDFWRAIPRRASDGRSFFWDPDLSALVTDSVSSNAAVVRVSFRAMPNGSDGELAKELAAQGFGHACKVLSCPFVAVKRGDAWFLCNGWFWPVT